MAVDARLRYANEQPLFVIGLIFSALVWLVLVVTIVGILYGLAAFLFVLVAHALFLAHIRGNGVRVSPRQFPDLHKRCRDAAFKLGLREMPEVYLIQEGGALNAFATKLLTRKFVVIYSDLVDQAQDPRQLDFVIGHELAHLAAGHLTWRAVLWPYMLLPWLGPAYSRACEYTCDFCGLHVVGDLEQSMRGLTVLAAGGKLAAQADLSAFMEQRLETGSFWSAVLELVSTHPYLCKRVSALQERKQPGSVRPVPRNPLAYVCAPIFGLFAAGAGAGGGVALLMIVAMIGIVAAIAIPSLLRARISANEAQALGDVRSVLAAEAAFLSANDNRGYGTLECLARPAACLLGYAGPALLDPGLAAATVKGGYHREFHAATDPYAGEPEPQPQAGADLVRYAYTAVPAQPGQTGVRSFCGDSRGVVCETPGGTAPSVVDGFCEPCSPVR